MLKNCLPVKGQGLWLTAGWPRISRSHFFSPSLFVVSLDGLSKRGTSCSRYKKLWSASVY